MANPELIVFDSDVLTQLFLANQVQPLKHLKDNFGIQPVIVEEVHIELQWLQRYRDRFIYQLQRALKSGCLATLDIGRFQSQISSAPLGASWESFQTLGQQFEGRVHRGEAYSFAAAVTLGMPAASNDYSAIRTLLQNFLPLPSPILRTFDLIAFCHQTGALSSGDCNALRKTLAGAHEHFPPQFKNASFEDGLKSFSPRLLLREEAAQADCEDYATPLYISPKQSGQA